MITKEAIKQASVKYNEVRGNVLCFGGASVMSDEEYIELNKNNAFIAGAEWMAAQMENEHSIYKEDKQ